MGSHVHGSGHECDILTINSEHLYTMQLNTLKRYCLIAVGWLAVVLGVIGIFLPLLPTTPFLLLAASCFAKSSERFHHWLLNQRHLGPYIQLYLNGKGIPIKAKCYILTLMWITIGSTAILFLKPWLLKILLLAIASGVTVYILRLPTLPIHPTKGSS